MRQKYLLPAIACLTLGLAPYVPEPHIVGKIRWILGGAQAMTPMDWGDAILHAAPWAFMIYLLSQDLVRTARKK